MLAAGGGWAFQTRVSAHPVDFCTKSGTQALSRNGGASTSMLGLKPQYALLCVSTPARQALFRLVKPIRRVRSKSAIYCLRHPQ